MTTAKTTVIWRCAICGSSARPLDEKALNCVQCNHFDGEVYKAVAQLKKAIKLHDTLVPFGARGPDIAEFPDVSRRMAEKLANVSESSDTTWAIVAYLSRTDPEK